MQDGQTVAVYKPKGITSHDLINQIRRKTGIKKIGHAGTLDPLAAGVLVVAIGRQATKKISQFVHQEKEYIATIKFGVYSTTDDEEGEKTKIIVNNPSNIKQITKTITEFIGQIEQIPPIYSAIKIKGKPAYKYARRGQNLDLKPRLVNIKQIEILDYRWPILKLRIVCDAGVYIRSLARDIGQKLEVGAYLVDLVRTRVGEFSLDKSLKLKSND